MNASRRIALLFILCHVVSATCAGGSPDWERAAREGRWGEFVKQLRESRVSENRAYQLGDPMGIRLEADRAICLCFSENPAGVKEFIFWNIAKNLLVVYGCVDDPYQSYSAVELNKSRTEDSRIIKSTDAEAHMEYMIKWTTEEDPPTVSFSTQLISSEEVARRRKEREKRWLSELRRKLEWDYGREVPRFQMIMDDPNDPNMTRLRTEYHLDDLVSDANDQYGQLRRLVKWVHDRWEHSGSSAPSKYDPFTILREAAEGRRFRCVEYSILVTVCARSLGMPSRMLGLKRPDVETARSGAGHAVAEVWLDQFKKWVLVDGQMDAIPEREGVPLNAVEFQNAIAQDAPALRIRSSSGQRLDRYILFVGPYLYYFDFNLDQRFFAPAHDKRRYEKIMLVPRGAKNPTVFQRNTPIANCTYTSDPNVFYHVLRK